jgi:hypothetical protein
VLAVSAYMSGVRIGSLTRPSSVQWSLRRSFPLAMLLIVLVSGMPPSSLYFQRSRLCSHCKLMPAGLREGHRER